MGMFRGLWVDDERSVPDDYINWTHARSFHEAIVKLELIQFNIVSLDHDLGCFYGNVELTGYHIVQWLVQRKMDGLYVPQAIRVHSANPVGRMNMEAVISKHFPTNKTDLSVDFLL